MNTAAVMLLDVLPPEINPYCCFLVEGSTYYHERSKTATELWDVVLVYPTPEMDGKPIAYRFLSSTQFGYGG